MNSNSHKLEKSIEECIDYNFDDNSHIDKPQKRINRMKSKSFQINGKVSPKLKKWSEFQANYLWLYVNNSNPKCRLCESAIKYSSLITSTSWTNPEKPLEITESSLDRSVILEHHLKSENHILAMKFFDSQTGGKSNNEITLNEYPDFMSKLEWQDLQSKFSWLMYRKQSFQCLICEEGYLKDRKLIFASKWNSPDRMNSTSADPATKNLQSQIGRCEKHQMSVNHTKSIELLAKENHHSNPNNGFQTVSSPISIKDEQKPTVSRKSIVFSPPNVTTRTAIRKSLCDRSAVPFFISEDAWEALKKEYPWIYFGNNVLRCWYCEDSYRNHSDVMIPTIWTTPDSTEEQHETSLSRMKSKGRLNRHENTKNHELAVHFLSLSQPNIVVKKSKNVQNEKEIRMDILQPTETSSPIEEASITATVPTITSATKGDFQIPKTVKASRKSAPVKLVNHPYEDKSISRDNKVEDNAALSDDSFSEKPSVISYNQSLDESVSLPSFLIRDQYCSLRTKYPWFFCKDNTKFGCSVCLEAVKIQPDGVSKTKFSSGCDQFDDDLTYFTFRKKLYRHSESKSHMSACLIVKRGSELSKDRLPQVGTTSESGASDSRFTRLKSGIRSKIDYKRMSEGFIENHEPDYSYRAVSPVLTVNRKRKDSSTVTWMCPQCKSHFSNADDLIQHISLCDYQSSDIARELACPCNPLTFRFNTITKLDLHAAQEHDTQSYFHCYICSDRYNRLSSLYHHMLIHHLITWDPFEAYLPVQPATEPFVCIFCASHHPTNLLLTQHYIHSTCAERLHSWIVLIDVSPPQLIPSVDHSPQFSADQSAAPIGEIHEEVTVLDVEELPEDKEVIYSPVKKSGNQHSKINRNHPFRRFGSDKKISHSKEVKKSKELEKSEVINEKKLDSKTVEIDVKIIDSNVEVVNDNNKDNTNETFTNNNIDITIASVITDVIDNSNKIENNNEFIDNIKEIDKSVLDETDNELKIDLKNDEEKLNPIEIEPKQVEEKELKLDEFPKLESKIDEVQVDIKRKSKTKLHFDLTPIDWRPKPKTKPEPKIKSSTKTSVGGKMRSKESTNNKLKTSRKLTNKPRPHKNILKSAVNLKVIEMSQVVDLNDIMKDSESEKLMFEVKIPNSVPPQVSQSTAESPKFKKQPIKIQSQLSPCKKLKIDYRPDDDIPSGLSFMDRMKKIRQLKKNRTEQQREQMMEIDRKIAEINEKKQLPGTIIDKLDRKKQSHHSDQNSTTELNSIMRESKPRLEKRKHSPEESQRLSVTSSLSTLTSLETPNQLKVDLDKSKSLPSPTSIKTELFSCEVCQMKFKSFRARDNHTTTEHKGLKLFTCKSCNLSFTTHILLRKHAQKYHIDNVTFAVFGKQNDCDINFSFQCSFCPLQFTSRSGLNHHITSGHKTEPENGPIIDEFLNKLMTADPKSSPLSCLICQEIMDNEFELDIHTIDHQKECQTTETEPTQFACPKCCRLFFGRDGKSYLKDHYNIVHLEKQFPVCEECETKFTSTVCYAIHKKTVKNCSKKTSDQLKIEDPYEKLNDPMKLAFVCSKCKTLVAGEAAEMRFEQHRSECNPEMSNDESLIINSQNEISNEESPILNSQSTECIDGQ